MGLYNIFIILYPWSQIACWSHCFYGIIQHLHHFVSTSSYVGHIVSMGLYNIFIILYPWSQIACWSHCFYGIIQHLHHFVSMVPNSMLVTLFLWDYTSSSFCIHGPKYGIIQHLHHFVSMVPNSLLVTLFLWDYTTSSSFCIHGHK